jgi:signal transduction histidine kinase
MMRWTTQRWFATVLVSMVVLILAGATIGEQVLARTAAVSNRLSDHISPARTAVVELDAALRDQASGLRGYALSSRTELLEPYQSGITAEQRAIDALRGLLGAEPALLADISRLQTATAQWRRDTADPLIEEQRRRGRTVTPANEAAAAENAFAIVRSQVAALDGRLVAERARGRADLDRARRTRDAIFTGLITLLLAAIALIAVLLRLVVLRPLGRLGATVRRVAAGDFEHRLTPHGPADVAALGHDVEAMRGRLVDALLTSRQALDDLEQRRLELARSNDDLEQFAYVASHDLQEPLRKVASFCQMLQRRYSDVIDDRGRQYIAFAVDGATRMQQLITDLLEFSRIGRLYDSTGSVDLNEIVDQVEQTLARLIEDSRTEIVRPVLPTVPGDPTLLTMLWQNLLGNAVKFRHPDRAARVEITATSTGNEWTFQVRDNGIGIDPQFADKIFVIFQRLHSRDAYTGTGIGLAICKKVVEHHGGTIHLDATHTEGTCMTFTLPGAEPAADEPARDEPAATVPPASDHSAVPA